MKLSALRYDPRIQDASWTRGEWNQVVEAVLSMTPVAQILHAERELTASEEDAMVAVAARTAAGEPLGYVLGQVNFSGLCIQVTPDVLIPRPDTEILLEATIAALGEGNGSMLDLCTGSGAVALAVKARCPNAQVTGSDVSEKAIRVAKANGLRLGLPVHWVVADVCQGLGVFDLIATNPPYISRDDTRVDRSVSQYEPPLALYADAEGLSVIFDVLRSASAHLVPNGTLLIEHGPEQHGRIAKAARKLGWRSITCLKDLAGRDRVTTMRASDACDD